VKKVAILGLGYVGLSVAHAFATCGYKIFGLEIDKSVIEGIQNRKISEDILSEIKLNELLQLDFIASLDPSLISQVDYVVICVPTPISSTGRPDLTYVVEASRTISKYLSRNQVVILESTSFPGTTLDVVQPILEESGLKEGKDFYIAFSSERVDPGSSTFGFSNTPKVVSAPSEVGLAKVLELYSPAVSTLVPTSNVMEAELSKLIENSYRLINIAFINEIARLSAELDVDFMEALDLAGTKPYGFQKFLPSVGVGGHCIPVDPVYLQSYLSENSKSGRSLVLDAAILANRNSPAQIAGRIGHEVTRIKEVTGIEPEVILLGITYKRNSSDVRESSGVHLLRILEEMKVRVSYYDPLTTVSLKGSKRINTFNDVSGKEVPLISVIVQPHSAIDVATFLDISKIVLDTTHSFSGEKILAI
jgi:nucleotide sugar dehydrogenase